MTVNNTLFLGEPSLTSLKSSEAFSPKQRGRLFHPEIPPKTEAISNLAVNDGGSMESRKPHAVSLDLHFTKKFVDGCQVAS